MKVIVCSGNSKVISYLIDLYGEESVDVLSFSPPPITQILTKGSKPKVRYISDKNEFSHVLRGYPNCSSCISCYSGYIYNQTDINHFKKPILNFHSGKIPDNRGKTPLFWDIIEGQERSYGTLHAVDIEIDMGRILAQVSIKIENEDNPRTLASKLLWEAFSSNIFPKWIEASPSEILSMAKVTMKGSYKRGFNPADNFRSSSHSASDLLVRWKCFEIWGGIYVDGIYYTKLSEHKHPMSTEIMFRCGNCLYGSTTGQ
jgi:methionyl-tRNA formyltransferase